MLGLKLHGKNDLAEVSKNLVSKNTDLKIILLNCQNNYIRKLIARMSKLFAEHCSLCLNFLNNYFERLTKLFPDLESIYIFNISVKSFFPYTVKSIVSNLI